MQNENTRQKTKNSKPKRFFEIMESNNKIFCNGRILMGFKSLKY